MENIGIHRYVMAIWSILHQLGIFYGHLVYFTLVGYSLWPFGYFNILRPFGKF
jgi:hypothetical protein